MGRILKEYFFVITEYRLKVWAEKSMNFQNFIQKSLNNENFDGYIQARLLLHDKIFKCGCVFVSQRSPDKAQNDSNLKFGTHTYLKHVKKCFFFCKITQTAASAKNVIKCAFFISTVKKLAFFMENKLVNQIDVR